MLALMLNPYSQLSNECKGAIQAQTAYFSIDTSGGSDEQIAEALEIPVDIVNQ